jgi:hypothetical protein
MATEREAYSWAVVPRATPDLLCNSNCAESYSRCFVSRITIGLVCRELLPPRCAENCAESYSRSVVPRATTGLVCRELLPKCVETKDNQSIAEFQQVHVYQGRNLPSANEV